MKQQLEAIVREALQVTSEETAVRMMEAHRKGRTVCLMITRSEQAENYQTKVEWAVLAPGEIAPGGAAA